MTLQQLKYIIEIARCGSINEAAKKLFITQPSLSSAVKELEQRLGIEIFVRSSKGVSLSSEGVEFLSYARQVVEQTELLEQRYINKKPTKRLCSISTQHYAFAVNAFVNLIKNNNSDEYEFTLRETRTYDIITDVASFKSEIGIIYLNDFNRKVLSRILKQHHLKFTPLFEASPHVFMSKKHPLAKQNSVTLSQLEDFPYLSFEQGDYNSFYFSEEILSTVYHKKNIYVSDRATLFNLLIGLNGYTISTGILNSDLNGSDIVAIPLEVKEKILVGWITTANAYLNQTAQSYIIELENLIRQYGFQLVK
ncbi:LysR family transcriptional regulator [Candidatus Schmidhempelia bombi]|jgi:DNA-binding transcriptional LysR family regulator|uniref:LysR family transcriptional regulator n=1 Tax=Candidatus Schmidhempelia bombi str. Bimp TaxID=1387197 RepID=A0AB94IBT9_9GAMM|nr:LysR family transcriptional regulator [Candidatus Schmidhempelia bombi]TEA26873.1 LysR family transcriptional regulator [Candidatus Schmidhempelia bombi str. Bimp]